MSVPPWFDALQVLVQVASHVAPCWQVRLLPAPIVAEQLLPVSQVTVADASAVKVQVAPEAQLRLELSAAVIEQVLPTAHCVSHEPPHPPVHDAPVEHVSLHPCVPDMHCPEEAKLHVVLLAQVHVVPEHEGGLIGPPSAPGIPTLVELPPHAKRKRKRAPKAIEYLVMLSTVGEGTPSVTTSRCRRRRLSHVLAAASALHFAVTFRQVRSTYVT